MTKSKIILITGCSSGFGLVTAVHLAAQGHHVIATMRDLNKQNTLLSELRHQNVAMSVEILRLDVADTKSIEDVKKHIAIKHGYLDVLINNAGFGMSGFFEDLSDKDIREQMEINFFGVQNVTRAMIPLMRARRQGKIINISSISGVTAYPCFGAYNASKWALEAFSESLYYEMRLFGIDVALVEPGSYKTKIFYDNARYAARFNDPESPYYKFSQEFKRFVMEHLEKNKRDPIEIAFLVRDIINNPHPQFRNIPDFGSQIIFFLRKILPFRLFSWVLYNTTFRGMRP